MGWGWCRFTPCTGVHRNTERKRTPYITDTELQALTDNRGPQLSRIIELLYLTAARESDLLKIRLSDLRDDGLYILHTKTQNSAGEAMAFTHTQRAQGTAGGRKKTS